MRPRKLKELGLLRESPTESSHYTFTSQATSDFDFPRLFDRKEDYYRLPAQVAELKKKDIIITDPCVALDLISDTKILSGVLRLWSALLGQGFAISVWTGKELLRVTKPVDLMPALKKIVPVDHHELINQLAKQGIASKDVFLAGVEQTKELMPLGAAIGIGKVEYALDRDRLAALPNYAVENFLACQSGSTLALAEVSFADLAALSKQKTLLSFLERYPAINFRSGKESEEAMEKILSFAKTFKKIAYSSDRKINWQQISKILSASPALEELNLNFCKGLGELTTDLSLPFLKKLFLRGTSTNWQEISRILTTCPALEELNLGACRELGDLTTDLPLSSLKKLSLESTNTNWQEVSHILSSCPVLEELDLSSCKQLGEATTDLPLSSLKKLHLGDSSYNWQQISRILLACPALEELHLVRCENLGEPPEDLPLSSLKKLVLDHGNSTWQQVSRILSCGPELEELSLDYCRSLGEMTTDLSLSSLKKLALTGTTITWQEVSRILSSCPALEELDLRLCKQLGELPEDLPLSSLKKLELPVTATNWQQVLHILSSCPALEELDLGFCKQLGELPKDLAILSNLININLKDTGVSDTDYSRLKMINPGLIIQIQRADQTPSEDSVARATKDKSTTLTLDSNTLNMNADLLGKGVFENIHPANYRLQVDDKIAVNADSVQIEQSPPDLQLVKLLAPTQGAETHTGRIELTTNEWQALPSLTVSDKLTSIRTVPDVELDIAYDSTKALYYIKPKSADVNLPILISFIIEAEFSRQKNLKPGNDADTRYLISQLRFKDDGRLQRSFEYEQFCELSKDEQLNALIAYFNQCEAKALSGDYQGHELLNAIISERAGVCRHRTVVCLALANALELPMRAVSNDLHAFIEAELDGKWHRGDLGGGVANVSVIPPPVIPDKTSPQAAAALSLSPDNLFRTWDTLSIAAESMREYTDKLLTHASSLDAGRQNVLSIMDAAQIPAFYTALFKQKQNSCFYLPNLDNVRDKQTVISDQDGGLEEQNSALKKFLAQAKAGDVLLVNWSDYQAEQVGYNSIMDPDRKIRGMTIPKGVTVVGLLDKSQKMGEDFYSRFRMRSECPARLAVETVLPKPETQAPADKTAREIRFYDDAWRSSLTGNITAKDGHYQLSTSALLQAIEAGETSVTLRNAPWSLPEFQLFITELLTKRQLEVNGVTHKIPDTFRLLRDDRPYSLSYKKYTVEAYSKGTSLKDTYILNPVTFSGLFQQFQSKHHQLNTLPGLLASGILSLFVTEQLSDMQWARIFKEAREHNIQLKLVLAPRVRLTFHPDVAPAQTMAKSHARLIETNDTDFVCDEISADTMIIPVNEKTTYADLTGTHKIARTDSAIACDYQKGVLTEALKAGKKVVLKGTLSAALIQELSSLFLEPPYLLTNGKRVECPDGQLTIVSTQNPGIHFITSEKVVIKQDELWKKLAGKYPEGNALARLKEACANFYKSSGQPPFQYIELKSMLDRLKQNPLSNPLKSLLRAKQNYARLKADAESAWQSTRHYAATTKTKTTQPVLEKRRNKLQHMLQDNWYAFVAGPSGVGKSTTINQALRSLGYEPVMTVGSLKDKLKAWLKPGAKRSLFVDEANMFEAGEFDLLEGLYGKPPKLLIDGVYYDVPPDNRIVFAGNFGHFHGRQELRFIARHGHVITFKEFDDAFLKESIIQPVCGSLRIEGQTTERIKALFLQIYHHINQSYPTKHPLTARNLQMMVMRYVNSDNPYLAAYDELSGVLNKDGRAKAADWMKAEFGEDVRALKRSAKEVTSKEVGGLPFPVTKKRINPVRIFDNLMQIRDNKINNPALAGAGSNGLIIEGNPGIGKSFIAIEYLRAQGFVNGAELSREQAEKKGIAPHQRYYHIQAGNLEDIKATLIKAFHEGAWVIIDEMNTLPLEHLLNALLSGITPEGKPAEHPGFFVTGTQNPVSFGHRSAYSDAYLNRFQKMDLKDYGKEDLLTITSMLQGADTDSAKLVDLYLEAKGFAKQARKFPEPTPRDLFEKAKGKPV